MRPKILVAYDFGPTAEAALTWAADLARSVSSPLTLLHVVHVPQAALAPGAVVPVYARESELATVRTDLRAAAARHGVDGAADVTVSASVGEAVVAYAAAHGVGLIAMGTHGRGGLARAVLGSAAEHVVRHAECPVVTLRHGAREPAPGPRAAGE